MDSEKGVYWLVGSFFVVMLFALLFESYRTGHNYWGLRFYVEGFVLLLFAVLWLAVFAWPSKFPTWLGVIVIIALCVSVLPVIYTIVQGFLIGLVLKNTTYNSSGMDAISYLIAFVFQIGMAVGMTWLFIIEKKRVVGEVKK